MATIDLAPLYRNTVGFDRMASILDAALRTDSSTAYPPYNIEVVQENCYQISLAVAGFEEHELELEVEGGVLTVRGKKDEEDLRRYLHKGIAFRGFERKFNLADYVQVKGAALKNGLLQIELLKVIPEQMKPRKISIVSAAEQTVHTINSAGHTSKAA